MKICISHTFSKFLSVALLIVFSILCSTVVRSEETSSPPLPDFNTINPSWWTPWSDLEQSEKVVWLEKIRMGFDEVTTDVGFTDRRFEDVEEIRDLLDSLTKLVQYESEERPSIKGTGGTLESWLELYRAAERLNRDYQRIQAEKKQRTDAIQAIQEQLREISVLHRKLQPDSMARISNGLSYYAVQINMLYAQRKTYQHLESASIH